MILIPCFWHKPKISRHSGIFPSRSTTTTAFVFDVILLSIDSAVLLQYADAILIGEGEDAVPELLEHEIPFNDSSFPAGWVWKDNSGELHSTGLAPMVDISELPLPAWSLYPIDKYLQFTQSIRGFPVMHIMSSRGCVHNCTFCDYESGRVQVRRRPAEHVVDEMQELSERYSRFGLKDFYFFDPSFMSSRKWSKQLYTELSNIGKFNWGCLARVDEIDKNILSHARESGCQYINFGVEAASDRILKMVGKGTNIQQVREAFQLCHDTGIRPGAFLLIGLPQETPEDIETMKNLLKDIRPAFINISIAAPFPGTVLAKQFKNDILTDDAFKFSDYFPDRTLFKNLKTDPVNAQEEITAFYKENVNSTGYVNPVTFQEY